MEKGNANAFYQLAGYYANGSDGMPQDWAKANELFLKAGELGCAEAYHNLGCLYICPGVKADKKKAKYYWEIAAIKGGVIARYKIGVLEGKAGNHQRAMKHFMIAAKAGYNKSLDLVQAGFMDGIVTKGEYESTLRAFHERQTEMKSEARDFSSRWNQKYP